MAVIADELADALLDEALADLYDELGLLTMLTSPTLWGLCSYFLPAMA